MILFYLLSLASCFNINKNEALVYINSKYEDSCNTVWYPFLYINKKDTFYISSVNFNDCDEDSIFLVSEFSLTTYKLSLSDKGNESSIATLQMIDTLSKKALLFDEKIPIRKTISFINNEIFIDNERYKLIENLSVKSRKKLRSFLEGEHN